MYGSVSIWRWLCVNNHIELKSFLNFFPSPSFVSFYSFDHITQTLSSFLLLSHHTALQYYLYLSCSITVQIVLFPVFSFPFSVILTCWLKEKNHCGKHQKTDQSFCLQTDYTLACVRVCVRVHVSVRVCVSYEQWLTLEKAKLPPPLQTPLCLWALLKGLLDLAKLAPVPLFVTYVFMHVCQSLHHVVKSQLLIRPPNLAQRGGERRGGRAN